MLKVIKCGDWASFSVYDDEYDDDDYFFVPLSQAPKSYKMHRNKWAWKTVGNWYGPFDTREDAVYSIYLNTTASRVTTFAQWLTREGMEWEEGLVDLILTDAAKRCAFMGHSLGKFIEIKTHVFGTICKTCQAKAIVSEELINNSPISGSAFYDPCFDPDDIVSLLQDTGG